MSQERPTCRLLPGAAAPNPALDPALKFPAVARFVSKSLATTRVFVVKMVVPAVDPLCVRERATYCCCRNSPALPAHALSGPTVVEVA